MHEQEISSLHRLPSWYLCAVAIFKDEAPYLEEWLAFCVSQGVEHILLYDNSSTDNPREVLRPWIAAELVELIDWPVPFKSGAQNLAALDALRRLRGRSTWVTFLDIDEYLFSPTHSSLPQILRQYEGHAGIVVNWQCYGSSGHARRPDGLTIESFTRRARTNWARNCREKTIVDPLLVTDPWGPHLFEVQPGHALVTERLEPVRLVRAGKWRRSLRHLAATLPFLPFDPYSIRKSSVRRVSVSDLRINHYVTRSEEDLPLKYKDRHTMSERDRRSHWRYHDRNEVEDPILASKADQVRAIIDHVRGVAAPPSMAAK